MAGTDRIVRTAPATTAALAVAAVGIATILGAWFFQFGLGYIPCPLCYEQRIPYYVGIPLALLVAFAGGRRAPRGVILAGLAALALIMLWGAGIAAYHAGVEWHWWAGPPDCSGAFGAMGPASDLVKQLENVHIVRCDEAAWRFLGISLAGYNAAISLALAAVAAWGLVRTLRPARGAGATSRYQSSSLR
jgi:disulfide bond formation protein DsbB